MGPTGGWGVRIEDGESRNGVGKRYDDAMREWDYQRPNKNTKKPKKKLVGKR